MVNSNKLVIKHHRPLHIVAVVFFSSIAILITTWIFLDESQWSYISSRLIEAKKNKELWDENQEMKQTIVNLEERIVMLERTGQVEQQTASNLQQQMIVQQDEIYKLKNELEFYQKIMDSVSESGGLNIQGLQIEKIPQPRSYYLKLILTHVSKNDKVVAGNVAILFEGVQGGVAKTIDIRELTLSETLSLSFDFNSFERIEGGLVLPEGFVAHRVIVKAMTSGKKKSVIERVFDWSEAVSR